MKASRPRLQGRTALVTGAGGGVGRGIALALAAEGANVVIAARRKATGDETAALIAQEQGSALVIECDVSVRTEVDAAVSAAVSTFGGLDIAVNNAVNREAAYPLTLEDVTDAKWHAQASVSWDAAYFLAQAALPHLKRSVRGCFIVLASNLGMHGGAHNPIYTALKGGVRGFVKALAREWGPYQITVNAIGPVAATEPTQMFFNEHPEALAELMRNFPLGRIGSPRDDIGRAVVAISSDEFGFVTAQNIQVDGGLYTAV
jgi:3-oxoacyl-[acyl-carrier protein] reductase